MATDQPDTFRSEGPFLGGRPLERLTAPERERLLAEPGPTLNWRSEPLLIGSRRRKSTHRRVPPRCARYARFQTGTATRAPRLGRQVPGHCPTISTADATATGTRGHR